MAKKQIKKLTIVTVIGWPFDWSGDLSQIPKEEKQTKEVLAIELPDQSYLDENGNIHKTSRTTFIQAKRTKVSSAVKEVFYDLYDAAIKKEKLMAEMQTLNAEIIKYGRILDDAFNKMQQAKGLLTLQEFINTFDESLPSRVKHEMNLYHYFYNSRYKKNSFTICRDEEIQKWYRGILVYEEYDGNYFMVNGAENYKEYKNYISKYSRPLSVKGKLYENLSLGDKNWLLYDACYEICIKKPMTKEYANELARKFAG